VSRFEALSHATSQPSLAVEVWQMLRESKKLWLLPIVIALFGFGALVALSGTAAAPFIYSLF
jgi:hypothetical protein